MSAPICTDCGQPITAQHYDLMCDGTARHELLRECLGVLKRALSAAESDRDRYRGALVALLEADRALKRTKAEQHKAYRGTVPHSGPILDSQMRALYDAAVAHNDAAEAHGRALNAAIAAVEEG